MENTFGVASSLGGTLRILRGTHGPLSPADAINLAAWLVAVADPDRRAFDKAFEEACNA